MNYKFNNFKFEKLNLLSLKNKIIENMVFLRSLYYLPIFILKNETSDKDLDLIKSNKIISENLLEKIIYKWTDEKAEKLYNEMEEFLKKIKLREERIKNAIIQDSI